MSGACPYFSRLLGPHLDGELLVADVAAVEAHVTVCERCREEGLLLAAMRRALRRSSAEVTAPRSLRERIVRAAEQEGRDASHAGEAGAASQLRARASAVASFVAAAGFAIAWGVSHREPAATSGFSAASMGMIDGDDILGDLLDEHAQPLPPEATDPREVRRLERYVGVPVQPSRMDHLGGRFIGGRVMPLHRNRAARLEYQIGSGDDTRRVSVFIFDPRKVQIRGGELSIPTPVGGGSHDAGEVREVRIARTRGYTVAVTQRGGVGYAVASDSFDERNVVAVLHEAQP